MSLRFRLNLLIASMFLGILLAGTLLVIHKARNAVDQELRSTANLASQLLEIAFVSANPGEPVERQAQLEKHINTLGKTRHLNISIRNAQAVVPILPLASGGRPEPDAPRWFVKFVEPDLMEMRRVVMIPGMPSREIVIRPDATDEITEAWGEALSLLVLLLAVFVVASTAVFFGIDRMLRPVATILQGLDSIERGDYRLRLPQIPLPELSQIGEKFNHMAQVLENSREENRMLKRKTLAIQEDERRRFAQELHDNIGQSINAIKAMAVSVEQGQADENIRKRVARIADISGNVYDEVRGMMRRLRPLVLDELGLVPTLQDIVDAWNDVHPEKSCYLKCSGELNELGDDLRITIYRVAQEFLTNSTKHSQATEVRITVQRRIQETTDAVLDNVAEVVAIELADNGKGFDKEKKSRGLGLLGMQERVESLHGKIQLQSSLGQGVKVSVILPIAKEQTNDERDAD